MPKPNYWNGAKAAVPAAIAALPTGNPYIIAAAATTAGAAGTYSKGSKKSKSGSGGKSDPRLRNNSNFDPNQQVIHDQQGKALQDGGGYEALIKRLQEMADPNSDYHKAYEEQQVGNFNEQTIPRLAERFAGIGGAGAAGGALSSSGFGQSLGAAGAGLQRDLAAHKMDTIQKAIEKLTGEYNNYQNRTTFDREGHEGDESVWSNILPALIEKFPEILNFLQDWSKDSGGSGDADTHQNAANLDRELRLTGDY